MSARSVRRDFRFSHALACLGTVALLWVVACGDDAAAPEPLTYDDVLVSGGEFAAVEPATVVADSATATEIIGNENWICTTRTYDVTKAPDEFPLFDPNSEIVFAGNLLQGATLGQATPSPIPVGRAGGTVVVTLVNGAPMGVSRTVPEVSLSSVFDAVNAIISQNPGEVPARFSFTMERVDSEQQMALAMNMSYDYLLGSTAAALSFSRNRRYNRFLVKLTQSFYSVAYQLPTTPGAMFADDVTPEQLGQYVGPGNPAAFISSVTYGRIFYLLIESTERVDSVAASVNTSFGGFKGGASGKYVGALENLVVKAFALGGDAGSALQAVTSDFDSLKTFLAQGGTIGTGVPISYVLRSVRHPEKVVKVGINTRYDVTDCIPTFETFGDPIIWLIADTSKLVRDGTSQRIERWRDQTAAENDAYRDLPAEWKHPVYVPKAVNGEMPAVEFGDSAALRFVGSGFAGRDYTLAVVASFVLNQDYGFNFLGGSTRMPARMLRAGFLPRGDPLLDPYEFGFDHFDDGLVTDRVPYPEQFHLYTMVFGRDRGMSIYIDGQLATSDRYLVEPLVDFLGARLGNIDRVPDASVTIAEFMAYAAALSDEQRRYLEDNLMRKYKF
jgi:hypothetical protein